jgi:hypothetical protein
MGCKIAGQGLPIVFLPYRSRSKRQDERKGPVGLASHVFLWNDELFSVKDNVLSCSKTVTSFENVFAFLFPWHLFIR